MKQFSYIFSVFFLLAGIAVILFFPARQPAMAMPTGGGGCSGTPITFIVNSKLDFDTINGLTGRANLGGNGMMTYSGSMGGAGLGIGGQVEVSGEKNCNVLISCTTTATISDGSNAVTVDSIEISFDTAVAFGSGATCQGLGTTVITQKLHNLSGKNTIFFGGSVDGTGTVPCCSPTFNTTNPGGNPVTLQVVYQNP